MVEVKEEKTFDEQIDILKSRGLIINDKEDANFVLSNVNYYRFTAYLLSFKNDDGSYKEGTTFEEVYDIYRFNKEFRILLTDLLGSIEIAFRTYIAYTLAIKHGACGYLERESFKDEKFYINFLTALEREKNNNSDKLFIIHHKEKYEGKLPIWVATEIMTFGMLSKLYSNMLPEDTRYIKNNLCRVNTLLVKSWLQSLTQVRNQCAHYGRIYNNNFRIITIKNEYKKYNLDNKKIFSYILAMKHLTMDKLIWNSFFIKLQKLINDYNNSIDLKLIGFPNNWIEILAK
ncbi:TPA: Abi family protein [Clostridioides difficile]